MRQNWKKLRAAESVAIPAHSSTMARISESLRKVLYDHQQNEEHVKLADLRHALLDVSGGQQRNHGSGQEKRPAEV